ncbi:MAG: hypothetical protein JST68_03340 [Bacteroidetes bacterium]|nr:hypothetical protein [Bacteroidota bacterium]
MILLWISVVFLFLLGWVLAATVEVVVDTEGPELAVWWSGIRVWNMDWEKMFSGERRRRGRKQMEGKRRQGRNSGEGRGVWMRMMRQCRVEEFYLSLDTGDYAVNAVLYPLNYYPWPAGCRLRVNFEDYNRLRMRIGVRPWRLLAAWVV